MTDERMGEGLWQAVRRLPRGSGIIFRHYATDADARRRLFARLLRIARSRELILVRAGAQRFPGEMGTHKARGPGLVTWPVHHIRDALAARRAGAHAGFVSPVFRTRSHPGEEVLGPRDAMMLAATLPMARIALGGMDTRRFRQLRGFHGWAAIDAWT